MWYIGDETSVRFLLCCPRFNNLRFSHHSKISDILRTDIVLPNGHLANILMYGSNVYNVIINKSIVNETIYFIKKSKRF